MHDDDLPKNDPDMEDEIHDHNASHLPPGGALPPGVLDLSILCIPLPKTPPWTPVASHTSLLAQSASAFFARFSRIHFRPLNAVHYSTLIPRRDPYGIGVPASIPPELRELVPEERIESYLEEYNCVPEESEQKMSVMGFMMERTPQFTLRNVMRATHETNPKMPPYQIEVWRYDEANPAIPNESSKEIYAYSSPDIDIITSSRALRAEREIRDNVIAYGDWLAEWGAWWKKSGKPDALRFIIPDDFLSMPRVRGRFATEEEAEEEAKDRKKQNKSVEYTMDNPDGTWS